jgi:hypothetical protein
LSFEDQGWECRTHRDAEMKAIVRIDPVCNWRTVEQEGYFEVSRPIGVVLWPHRKSICSQKSMIMASLGFRKNSTAHLKFAPSLKLSVCLQKEIC